MRKNFVLLILIIFLVSCTPAGPSSQAIETAMAETQLANIVEGTNEALSQAPTEEPTQPPPPQADTPVPTESPTVEGFVNSFNLNLRAGPSTFHEILTGLSQDQRVTATARSIDNIWVLVESGENNQVGYVASQYVTWFDDLEVLPLIDFPEYLTLRGRVIDQDGLPIDNVLVGAIYRFNDQRARTEASSNENGEFVLYLSEIYLNVELSIEAIGPGCDSRIVNRECESQYFEVVDQFFVTAPENEELVFIYEKATHFITGKVTTRGGWGVNGIVVFAEREGDFADAQTLTNEQGEFTLAVGPGTWKVVAIRFIPYFPGEESEPLFITINEGDPNPEPIFIITPWQGPQ